MELKPEDLKAGMIFEKHSSYVKIFKITKTQVLYEYLIYEGGYIDYFGCNHTEISDFLYHCSPSPLDKVPTKIVEVEEEVPVYLFGKLYTLLLKNGFISSCDLDEYGNGIVIGINSICSELIYKYTELCKIKIKVRKELEFNWETGVYE